MSSKVSFEIEGFIYQPDFISEPEEQDLTGHVQKLEFSEIKMHGVTAKRRVIHLGWIYGYESWRLTPGPPIPEFLAPLRGRAADLLHADPAALAEVLITEYTPGAVIGWHRDAPMFGGVVGVSLLASCRMRFRRGEGAGREIKELPLERRSAYALTGPARSEWQHSIPAVKALRYSITFRTLRKSPQSG